MTTRLRARDLGIAPGDLPTGPHNAITDVPGVRIGHVTLHEGRRFHTGVTAIVPDALSATRKAIPAALFVGNGYGKFIGATQIAELGEIETPIILTATLSAFRAADALVSWMLERPGHEETRSLNPVVGETNDGELSDIRARPITEAMVREALDTATPGPVPEGCVGAGAGTSALGYKAGIGTSSRLVEGHTVGALVQANFSGTLTLGGTPLPGEPEPDDDDGERGNSCMIVVATDAPLDSRQLGRLARRAVFAMGRVGAAYTHGSGDYGLAFTTAGSGHIPDKDLNPYIEAIMDAVEEALLNSLFMAETTHGHRGTRPAIELARVCHAIGT